MALIPCKECGSNISNKAVACPKCGCPEPFEKEVICNECGNSVPKNPDGSSCPNCGNPDISIEASGSEHVYSQLPTQLIWSWSHPTGFINSVAVSPDGNTIATGGYTQGIYLLDKTGRKISQIPSFIFSHKSIKSIAFNPNGNLLALAGEKGLLKLRDVNTGKKIHSLPKWWNISPFLIEKYSGKRPKPDMCCVAFSPDGSLLATGDIDGPMLWNVNSGKFIHSFSSIPQKIHSIAFSPDGHLLATGGLCFDKSYIRLYDVETQNNYNDVKARNSYNSDAFGEHPLGGSNDISKQHRMDVYSVVFSPDGQMLASAGFDSNIILSSLMGTVIHKLCGHENTVNSLAFSPDGSILASGSDDKTIKLWEVSTGKEIHTLSPNDGAAITSLTFSPDGFSFIVGSFGGNVTLWQ